MHYKGTVSYFTRSVFVASELNKKKPKQSVVTKIMQLRKTTETSALHSQCHSLEMHVRLIAKNLLMTD